MDKVLPRDCPSYKFYSEGRQDRTTPAFLLIASSLDDVIGELIKLTGGGADVTSMDTLSELLRGIAWNYTEATEGLAWKDSVQQLPLHTVCNSLTTVQGSELAIQFRHHAGLSLSHIESVHEFLLASFSVRFYGNCNTYQREKLTLESTNFITRFDFMRHATFRPEYMANIFFMIKGKYYHVLQWFPKLISRIKFLFHPSSGSNYYRYLANGLIQFRNQNCTVRMITNERFEQQFNKNPHALAMQIIYDYHQGKVPLPPYMIVKQTPLSYWKKTFPRNYTQVRDVMLSNYHDHALLSSHETIRLAVLLNNQKQSQSSIGDFELMLQSITATNNFKAYVRNSSTLAFSTDRPLISRNMSSEQDFEPLVRDKRSPVLMLFTTAVRMLSRLGARLVSFFRSWAPTVIGSPLGRAVQRVHTALQGSGRGYVSQLRTEHSMKQVMARMGPVQRQLLPYVRSQSLGTIPQRVRQLKFGPNRYSALQLPSPIRRQLGMFSPERLKLKQRSLDFYSWSKKNAITLGATGATIGLFAHGLTTMSDPSNQYESYDPNPLADGAHVYQAAQDWHAIANGSFFAYEPYLLTQEEHDALQTDVFGNDTSPGMMSINNTQATVFDSTLQDAYANEVISIYDKTLPQDLRRRYLLQLRRKNQRMRELDSMTLCGIQYVQQSPLHEKAYHYAEAFFGVIMESYDNMIPQEHFIDTMLRNLISDGNVESFIDETDQYIDLLYVQIQDLWDPEERRKYAASAQTAERLKGSFTQEDLDSITKTSSPRSKEIFMLLLRKSGQEHIRRYNQMMDFLLSAESERRYWEDNYGSHRLLYKTQVSELPNSSQDYLMTLFWFQLYFAEPGRKESIDKFVRAMNRLSSIRLYDENRAVGLPLANLKRQISKIDLDMLDSNGLSGIAAMTTNHDSTTFTDYGSLAELAGINETLLDYAPSEEEYQDDTDGILTNELVGLNNVNQVEGRGRRKRTVWSHDYKARFRRHLRDTAHQMLGNMTQNPVLIREMELLLKDPQRSSVLQRMKIGKGPLGLKGLIHLEEQLRDPSKEEGYSISGLKQAHDEFLVSTLRYFKENEVPGEMMALVLSPEHATNLPAATRAELQSARRVLKIKPLSSIIEKLALMDYIRSMNAGKPVTPATVIEKGKLLTEWILLAASIFLNAAFLCGLLVKYCGPSVTAHIAHEK